MQGAVQSAVAKSGRVRAVLCKVRQRCCAECGGKVRQRCCAGCAQCCAKCGGKVRQRCCAVAKSGTGAAQGVHSAVSAVAKPATVSGKGAQAALLPGAVQSAVAESGKGAAQGAVQKVAAQASKIFGLWFQNFPTTEIQPPALTNKALSKVLSKVLRVLSRVQWRSLAKVLCRVLCGPRHVAQSAVQGAKFGKGAVQRAVHSSVAKFGKVAVRDAVLKALRRVLCRELSNTLSEV